MKRGAILYRPHEPHLPQHRHHPQHRQQPRRRAGARSLGGGIRAAILALGCATLLVASGCADSDAGSGEPFVEFAWGPREPDVRSERLCREAADPDHAGDTTFIDCVVEGATFAAAAPPPADEIVVLAYNVERGFQADHWRVIV